jgi:hypothetical protein
MAGAGAVGGGASGAGAWSGAVGVVGSAGARGGKSAAHVLRSKALVAGVSAVVLAVAIVTAAAVGKLGPFAAKPAAVASGAPFPTAAAGGTSIAAGVPLSTPISTSLSTSLSTSQAASTSPTSAKLPDACALLTAADVARLTGWADAVPHPAGDDRSGCNWRIETRGGTVVSYGFAAATRERYDQIENIPGLQVLPGLGDVAKRSGDSTMIYWHGMIVQVVVFSPGACCDTLDKQTAVARALLAKT